MRSFPSFDVFWWACREAIPRFDVQGAAQAYKEESIVKYMLLIYGNEDVWASFPPDQFSEVIRETDAQLQELRESGELVGAYGVADQINAKTVRLEDGVPAVTDGPYIEAKEYLGSFTIIDCESEERALEIAARNPAARFTSVEIRPLMHESVPEV
jgi:hypothetical protein